MPKNRVIDLFGTKWRVYFKDQVFKEEENGTKEWLWGVTYPIERKVYISTKYQDDEPIPKDELKLTIIHELLHCCFISGQYDNANMDEPLVEWTARCIKSILDKKGFEI